MNVKFKIGRYEVSITNSLFEKTFSITKDEEEVYNGELKKILNKYRSCFDKNTAMDYAVASVCLEYALEKINK